ncbi:MAG: hypothetical protein OM95_04640 [Bdellovibrio sp. ArHS]|uniref:hypothetical protein n=1 Tax=Bdellovibrio sp. ArHS TaxID=1569284 RepID=UPI0005827768|nr:hypothetical protein [Bdellovibrio sp. ArHS]KHD89120.1 MAG: hypothetical protein OM95_04640 [Bdellovibrio sp. ArHS]
MKTLIVTLAALLGTHAASAETANLFKTFDGSMVHCQGDQKSLNAVGSKAIQVELINPASSQKNLDASLKVSVVRCQDSRWVMDNNPARETYIADNNVSVEVKYSNYEALIVDKDYQVVSVLNLGDVESQSAQTQSLSVNKTAENPQDLEVIVRATVEVRASNGYYQKEVRNFGSYRLRIQK